MLYTDTNSVKWLLSVVVGLVFILVSIPGMYSLTNNLTKMIGFPTTKNTGPTVFGIILHGIVAMLIIRLILLI
jgi:hypothetical protein